jgi:hypothetical protein
MKLNKEKIKGFIKEFELLQGIVEDNSEGLIMDKSREREHIIARMAFTKILIDKEYTLLSIGTFMDKDHATVIHYRNEFDELCKSDPRLRITYDDSLERFDAFPREIDYMKSHKNELRARIKNLESSEAKLKSQINVLNLRLESELNKGERLKGIIDIVKDRTKEGTEGLVEGKIKRFYNGVYER